MNLQSHIDGDRGSATKLAAFARIPAILLVSDGNRARTVSPEKPFPLNSSSRRESHALGLASKGLA